MSKYYDGTKLLNTKDLDGLTPGIFMIAGNRTAGKTYWCKKFMLNEFIRTGRKFIILVRFGTMLPGTVDTFFKDLGEIDFIGHSMKEVRVVNNAIFELFFDNKPCGYSICINNADMIKRNSTMFVDVDTMFLDEFQSETNKYCPGEIGKFISIYTSVARGAGKQSRYVRVLMASNNVSLFNPYYYELGVSSRLRPNTKFLRGTGWVLEVTYNEGAAKAISQSPIGRAFSSNEYIRYSTGSEYLKDSDSFIVGKGFDGNLVANLIYDEEWFGVWIKDGKYLISKKHNKSYDVTYAVDSKSHNENTILLFKSSNLAKTLSLAYAQGCLTFGDLRCKELGLKIIDIRC